MMNGYNPLNRNRRRSNPSSPTSPILPKRSSERTNKASEVFDPIDRFSLLTLSDNGSLDLRLGLPSSPPTSNANHRSPESRPVPSSFEDGRSRPRFLGDVARPVTSDTLETSRAFQRTSNIAQSNDHITRSSPISNSDRAPQDKERHSDDALARRPDFRSLTPRQLSTSSPVFDRGLQDEQGPAKSKKSRLNLLNPMSLLARRRSSQLSPDKPSLTVKTWSVPALPDNFNPSIRGTITHDFSAPRTKRITSYGGDGSGLDQSPRPDSRQSITESSQPADKSSPRAQRPLSNLPNHSPLFREHFQDETQPIHPDQTRYLQNATTSTDTSQLVASVPAFAKNLPVQLPEEPREVESIHTAQTSDVLQTEREELKQLPPTPPKESPSSVLDLRPSELPKHMKSTSSRFSFQLNASSAQEKILEEKHKEHQDGRTSALATLNDETEEDNYDDYDFDDEDGLEERIPGVNADLDDKDYDDDQHEDQALNLDVESDDDTAEQTSVQGDLHTQSEDSVIETEAAAPNYRQSLQEFHFTPQTTNFSVLSSPEYGKPTPRDSNGLAIGVADFQDHSYLGRTSLELPQTVQDDINDHVQLDGLGITALQPCEDIEHPRSQKCSQDFDDLDIYFDDGGFGEDIPLTGNDAFDESIFDDDSGQIRDIPAENARRLERAKQTTGLNGEKQGIANSSQTSQDISYGQDDIYDALQDDDQQRFNHPHPHPGTGLTGNLTGLTEMNLAAYHNALAQAANDAAANGKFSGKIMTGTYLNLESDDDRSQSQYQSSQPGLVSDESRLSNVFDSSGLDDDGFPYDDDDMDDELMIAEANAEALENDDEGFYGQEFGFYARARSKNDAELVNGGFFGARGSNGIKRSHSGRANFQEPSLTPITERSEWSARNSVASLQIPNGIPGSASSIPSPGLAQLLEKDSPSYDDDMSFSALLRLQRKAFGGSSTSINSLGGSAAPGSSPLAHISSYSFPVQDHAHGYYRMSQSSHSQTTASVGIPESEEEEDDEMERPTLTQNTPRKIVSDPSPISPNNYNQSPLFGLGERRKAGHSRNSSGAESVSYARDSDGRWVLERRRTAEDGGLEIIDREYLEGAHI